MKASVIIPTKNPGSRFRKVLAAVLSQSTNFDYEVLVIDSGSTDGTKELIEKISDERVSFRSIPPETFGHGKTRNLGISMSSGEYAVLITHDATPINDLWLEELVTRAETDSEIAGVFGRHIAYPEADPFTARELDLHFKGFEAWEMVSLEDRERYDRDLGYRQVLHFFSDNNALVRRSVWERHPYPDVDFAEDQMWAQRIIEAGYKKAYAPKAVVMHSHTYSLLERLQRSFDESYAFNRLFGYELCPNFSKFISSYLALTRRDLSYALEEKLWRSHSISVAKLPFDNFMRLTGHYLGSRGSKLPEWLRERISYDRRLMLGLRSVNKEITDQ